MSNKITYRPNLIPERSYESKGKTTNSYQHQEISVIKKEEYEEIGEIVENIKHYAAITPTVLKPLTDTILNAIELFYYYVDPDKVKPDASGDEEITIKPGKNDNIIDKDKETILSKFQPSFIIRIKEPNLIDKIEYDYYTNLLQLVKHHSLLFQQVMNDYYVDVLTILQETEGVTPEYVCQSYRYAPLEFKNPNNKHVSDYIVRSQIVKDQKMRMSTKLFNDRETMNIIKACEASKELLKKYVGEEFEQKPTQKGLFKSLALNDSIKLYEYKVDANLKEFYKYLTSSIDVLRSCLEMQSNEIKAKTILLEEEGITL